MKLTSTQTAARLNVNPYTLKRWYEFYNDLDEDEILNLHEKHGMPLLPQIEIIKYAKREDKLWKEEDIPILERFRDWVPPTKSGIFKKQLEGDKK